MHTIKFILDIITIVLIVAITIDTLQSRKQLKVYDDDGADTI